ncbi:MAG TPA: biotin/lipoyl-binding protein [Candidatus Dormibacteraeota bacterium]|nr:biotin/lipoyl-binding protein [Candidatus Dormibacteraeota bacterium]
MIRNIQVLPQPSRRLDRLRNPRTLLVVLVVVVVVLAAVTIKDVFFPTASTQVPGRLVAVSEGTVTATVTGTGSILPANQANVNFKVGGTLTEVDVKVGDQVKAGQVLAKIDPTPEQEALQQAQAQLQSAEANLQAAQDPASPAQVTQLQHNLAAAQQSYNDTAALVNLTNQQDAQAVAQARAQYNADQCGTASANASKCPSDEQALTSAEQKQQSDALSGQQRLDQASQSVTSAQDALNVATQPKPGSVQQAQAQVVTAQAQVNTAQQNLNATTLTAPISGVVTQVNGSVGQTIGAGSGAAQATSGGSTSSASSTGGASGGGASSSAGGASSPTTSSGSGASSSGGSSAFITIADTSSFQAVVPFAEVDAAKLQSGQQASITFPAIPNLTITGTLLSVSPVAQVVSNVVDYVATFNLLQNDPRLRSGMTANASVIVQQVQNALSVPNLAIRNQGGTTVVDVYRNGKVTPVEVEEGLVGDTATEVRGDLRPGEEVVLPTTQLGVTGVGGAAGAGGGRGGGFGGLGGLGILGRG